MTNFVYSSLICKNIYSGISINGCNDIFHGKDSSGLVNPKNKFDHASLTVVNDEQIKILKNNETFKKHIENGFILISDKQLDLKEIKLNFSEKLRSPSENV